MKSVLTTWVITPTHGSCRRSVHFTLYDGVNVHGCDSIRLNVLTDNDNQLEERTMTVSGVPRFQAEIFCD